jgi:hypothetical protein
MKDGDSVSIFVLVYYTLKRSKDTSKDTSIEIERETTKLYEYFGI